MKKKAVYFILAIFIILALIGCGDSGKTFKDVEKVEEWLAKQKGGTTPDNPIIFSLKLNLQNMASPESNWQKLLASINKAGQYIALDLSGSTMPTTVFDVDGDIETGKQFIVSLVLPNNTESVSGNMLVYFNNLRTVKAKKIDFFAENISYWLSTQKGGRNPNDPISLGIKTNLGDMYSYESDWHKILYSINKASLYVALDLSGSTMPDTAFDVIGGGWFGKEYIVSLILPDSTEFVNGNLFEYFVNLQTVNAKNMDFFIENLSHWLTTQKGGESPDDPILINVNQNLQEMDSPTRNWQKLLYSINKTGLYVALDLSGSTMLNTVFDADGGTKIGKQFIVSLVLPDSTESVNGVLPAHFANLRIVKSRMAEYFIGMPGPAGGIVFYDKGENSNGWRYLEAAPTDMTNRLRWVAPSFGMNSENFPYVDGTSLEIGTGKQNTALILAVDDNAPAAKACAEYTINGFSDWFLPSFDEIKHMYQNLRINNIGSFDDEYYWSSSNVSTRTTHLPDGSIIKYSSEAYDLSFGLTYEGGRKGNGWKFFERNIRAVRCF